MGTCFWQCSGVDEARVRTAVVRISLVHVKVPFSSSLGDESPVRPLLLQRMFATGEDDHCRSFRDFLVVHVLTLGIL